jgi:hypothetical protein
MGVVEAVIVLTEDVATAEGALAGARGELTRVAPVPTALVALTLA